MRYASRFIIVGLVALTMLGLSALFSASETQAQTSHPGTECKRDPQCPAKADCQSDDEYYCSGQTNEGECGGYSTNNCLQNDDLSCLWRRNCGTGDPFDAPAEYCSETTSACWP